MSVEFQSELKLLEAVERLGKIEVMPRRYFRPSLDETNGIGKGRKIERNFKKIPMYTESLRNKGVGSN